MQPDDYKSIDLYLQNELSEQALKAFHDRIENDQVFAAEFGRRREMNNYLRTKATQPALEKKMASLGKQYFQPEATVKSLAGRRWLLGVAAAVLVGLMLWLWNPFTTPDLYTQYVDHPELLLAERGADQKAAAEAEAAFNAEDYSKAYAYLQTLTTDRPDDMQVLLATGIAALETGKAQEAEAAFQRIASSDSSFQSYGYWYLALSALKRKDYEEVKLLLLKIDDSDTLLKKKAEQLLQELN